ncbi:MAG: hypothetical protein GC171_14635 [Terrimonas sp.]|nr:hypothetical protein [Terrimonas sp.]
MKKFLAIIAITGFVACNNASESETPATDTTTKVEAPAAADTTMTAPADTTKAADTTKPAM